MTKPDMLTAALEYAEDGWPVFPVRHDKTPYTPNGVLDATTDRKKIRKWWEKYPGANIAVNCGEAGLLVLDYDPGSDIDNTRAAVGDLPDTQLVARTPRGGAHHYYELDESDPPVSISSGRIAPHVDVRSFHGYVLLPPSRTADGEYTWEQDGQPRYRSADLIDACGRARDKHKNRDDWAIDPDLPGS